jgi:hypothetical protein
LTGDLFLPCQPAKKRKPKWKVEEALADFESRF